MVLVYSLLWQQVVCMISVLHFTSAKRYYVYPRHICSCCPINNLSALWLKICITLFRNTEGGERTGNACRYSSVDSWGAAASYVTTPPPHTHTLLSVMETREGQLTVRGAVRIVPHLFPLRNSASKKRIPSLAPAFSFFNMSSPSITANTNQSMHFYKLPNVNASRRKNQKNKTSGLCPEKKTPQLQVTS